MNFSARASNAQRLAKSFHGSARSIPVVMHIIAIQVFHGRLHMPLLGAECWHEKHKSLDVIVFGHLLQIRIGEVWQAPTLPIKLHR